MTKLEALLDHYLIYDKKTNRLSIGSDQYYNVLKPKLLLMEVELAAALYRESEKLNENKTS